MSILKLKGSTSGYVELTAPATAGNNTITLPTTAGTVAVRDASNNTEVGTGVTVGSPASNTFTVSTAGSERIRIDSSGRLAVGTTSASVRLHVNVDSASETDVARFQATNGADIQFLDIGVDATNNFVSYDSTGSVGGAHVFRRGGGEVMRLDDGSRMLVGTSASRAVSDWSGNGPQGLIQIESTNSGAIMSIISAGTADAQRAGTLSLGRHRNSTVGGTPTVVQSGDALGAICFAGGDGTDMLANGASIRCEVDGTPGTDDMPGRLVFSTTADGASIPTERMRIDSNGQLAIGAAGVPNTPRLSVRGNNNLASGQAVIPSTYCGVVISSSSGGSVDNGGAIWFDHGDLFSGIAGSRVSTGNWGTDLRFYTHPDSTSNQYTLPERMRISSTGAVLVGKTGETLSTAGGFLYAGYGGFTRDGNEGITVNRLNSDGVLVEFRQDTIFEGSISVSGTTVSYNGAHLSRWSQLPSDAERTEILRGSVLSNIDEMCEWGDEDNEQLNRMKVSDVEGDKNVSGVFQAWDDDDDTYTNDFYCAMTGDFIIRIGAGVTVERGDLLMSAGDGTAMPQDDDIIRSKTIAKVTSTNVSCTYPDGSYCVPCVLMAC